jgi:curved DNA-binding protein CbpA
MVKIKRSFQADQNNNLIASLREEVNKEKARANEFYERYSDEYDRAEKEKSRADHYFKLYMGEEDAKQTSKDEEEKDEIIDQLRAKLHSTNLMLLKETTTQAEQNAAHEKLLLKLREKLCKLDSRVWESLEELEGPTSCRDGSAEGISCLQ